MIVGVLLVDTLLIQPYNAHAIATFVLDFSMSTFLQLIKALPTPPGRTSG